MPIFSYFLVVGSILTGLLFSVDTVIAPSPLSFKVSQRIGLPKSYKAPVVAEFPKPDYLIATTVKQSIAVTNPVTDVGPRSIFKSPNNRSHL